MREVASVNEPVSIVIPFVSGIAYLREALHSAVNIPSDNVHIIVSDNTREPSERRAALQLVDELADPRVSFRAFDQHVEICSSFNRAMECATTDLVTLLHSDDRIGTNYVDVIRDLARAFPDAAAYYCAARIIDKDGRRTFSFVDWVKWFLIPGPAAQPTVLAGRAGVEALARGNFIISPAVCFRKSRLRGERWPDGLVQVADLEFWTRLLFAGEIFVGTRRIAYEYRRHAGQGTAQSNASLHRYREESAVYNLIAERAAARGWSTAERTSRLKLVTRLHLLYDIVVDICHLRLTAVRTKVSYLVAMP
jgi:glycosyltransferase involved in cell wall biosynthesis